LLRNFKTVGFLAREGYSAGYLGYLDGFVYSQLPEGAHAAFANQPFEFGNNHGWVFIGTVSRERVGLLHKVKHRYVSFNRARDALAQRLDRETNYRIKAFVSLNNAVIGDSEVSTGDHDAIAVLLRTVPPSSKQPGKE
jgi:hypothetical protein